MFSCSTRNNHKSLCNMCQTCVMASMSCNILRKRGLCPLTCRFLAFMYTNQSLKVNWYGYYSNPFPTSNGVKHGGILSPILFCVYMDELISRLKQSGVGCFIGDIYLDRLGYADDLCLLTSTRSVT